MVSKNFFQKILVKYGNFHSFKQYITRQRLDDCYVDYMIQENKVEFLTEYIRHHMLSSYQVTNVLHNMADKPDEKTQNLVQQLLRSVRLTAEQEQFIVSKNDVLYLEAYLSPKGYFEPERRFGRIAEYHYIRSMIKTDSKVGLEIFKSYVANCAKDLLTDELLKMLMENPDSQAAIYVLQKARISREQEDYFITHAEKEQIVRLIKARSLFHDSAQLLLIQNHYDLAENYFKQHGLRSQAQQLYHSLRRQEFEKARQQEPSADSDK